MKEYAHYKNYPKDKWRWKNFRPIEMRSKGDNKLAIDEDAMDKLQALRELLDKPLHITSAYRSASHNKSVGSKPTSQHRKAKAFDVRMENHDPAQFEAAAREVGFTGFGFYEQSDFIHIDTGPARAWGTRWFDKAPMFNRPIPDMAQLPETAPPSKDVVGPVVVIGGSILAAITVFFDKFMEKLNGIF